MMKKLLVITLVCLTFVLPVYSELKTISPEDAGSYYGEYVAVKGKIVGTHRTAKVCFLNFSEDWKTGFTAVIFRSDWDEFPSNPEDFYLNKEVVVAGRIKEYQGKPEIILKDAAQIKVIGKTKEEKPVVISWQDADKYYGKYAVVKGEIVATHNTGKVCFLNFHRNWKRYFTAVIFRSDFDKFPQSPENYYLNKKVEITGYIKEYQGKPEIIIKSPSQIKIIK